MGGSRLGMDENRITQENMAADFDVDAFGFD